MAQDLIIVAIKLKAEVVDIDRVGLCRHGY
jgi:hypothetical protein